MLPFELKKDKEGLFYIDDKKILKYNSLLLDNRIINENKYDQYGFYRLFSTDEYIIKYNYNPYMKEARERIKKMLFILQSKQDNISTVDFPIGYYKKFLKLQGLIIKYYKNGISLDNTILTGDIEGLGKYYYHDEDNIHNLFLLFNEILDTIYEMFENGIYYRDIHPGNIVLTDNKAKIIDFDYRLVHFNNKDSNLAIIMSNYDLLLRTVLNKYNLFSSLNDYFTDFEQAKVFTKKLENSVRKY